MAQSAKYNKYCKYLIKRHKNNIKNTYIIQYGVQYLSNALVVPLGHLQWKGRQGSTGKGMHGRQEDQKNA